MWDSRQESVEGIIIYPGNTNYGSYDSNSNIQYKYKYCVLSCLSGGARAYRWAYVLLYYYINTERCIIKLI